MLRSNKKRSNQTNDVNSFLGKRKKRDEPGQLSQEKKLRHTVLEDNLTITQLILNDPNQGNNNNNLDNNLNIFLKINHITYNEDELERYKITLRNFFKTDIITPKMMFEKIHSLAVHNSNLLLEESPNVLPQTLLDSLNYWGIAHFNNTIESKLQLNTSILVNGTILKNLYNNLGCNLNFYLNYYLDKNIKSYNKLDNYHDSKEMDSNEKFSFLNKFEMKYSKLCDNASEEKTLLDQYHNLNTFDLEQKIFSLEINSSRNWTLVIDRQLKALTNKPESESLYAFIRTQANGMILEPFTSISYYQAISFTISMEGPTTVSDNNFLATEMIINPNSLVNYKNYFIYVIGFSNGQPSNNYNEFNIYNDSSNVSELNVNNNNATNNNNFCPEVMWQNICSQKYIPTDIPTNAIIGTYQLSYEETIKPCGPNFFNGFVREQRFQLQAFYPNEKVIQAIKNKFLLDEIHLQSYLTFFKKKEGQYITRQVPSSSDDLIPQGQKK